MTKKAARQNIYEAAALRYDMERHRGRDVLEAQRLGLMTAEHLVKALPEADRAAVIQHVLRLLTSRAT